MLDDTLAGQRGSVTAEAQGTSISETIDFFLKALSEALTDAEGVESDLIEAVTQTGEQLTADASRLESELAAVREELAETQTENDRLESELSAVREELAETQAENDRLESELSAVREELAETQAENDRLKSELAAVREESAETKDELGEMREYINETNDYAAQERAELASRVTDLEESTDGSKEGGAADDTPTPEIGEPGPHDTVHAVTPLEEAVNFPPRVAERELSENRLRGRFIARDPKQYFTNVQGGWMMTPSDMRTVISAYQGGGSVHPETLRRVREFLAEWGKGEVSIRRRKDGTNVVVFTDEIVSRLVKITGSDHEVVTGQTAVPG